MTDLATKPGADGLVPDAETVDESEDSVVDDVDVPAADEPEEAGGESAVEDDELPDDEAVAAADPDEDPAESLDEGADSDEPSDEPTDVDADESIATETVTEPADETGTDVPEDATAETAERAPLAEETAELASTSPAIADLPTAAAPTISPSPDGAGTDTASYAWAPVEPKPKKSRKALWISIAAGAAVVGLVASSLVLIAPGTSVAGVPVGGLTPGMAADTLQQRLADTTIVLVGDGGDAEITGADLGAAIDARELADAAFAAHPMWNPTQWFAAADDADITIDPVAAAAALRAAAPELYVDPVDATLAFDASSATYVTTPGEAGQGIDTDAVLATLQDAYDSGESVVEFDPVTTPVEPLTTTAIADETAASLNGILGTAGFYVGDERTVPIDRAAAASWLTVTRNTDGTFEIAADEAAIQSVVDTLPAAINRDVVNATVITDSGGKVLSEMSVGSAGRSLDDTTAIAGDYAAQLAAGDGVFTLPVTVQEFTTTTLARRIEVDLSEQHTYLYENNTLVQSWPISSGTYGHDTNTGSFRINAKLPSQNMGNPDLTQAPNYYTQNVPNVMYFNGDQALHGAYWHNNFGRRMSHGCVNMPLDAAAFVYGWAPIGTEVWVHG